MYEKISKDEKYIKLAEYMNMTPDRLVYWLLNEVDEVNIQNKAQNKGGRKSMVCEEFNRKKLYSKHPERDSDFWKNRFRDYIKYRNDQKDYKGLQNKG